MFHHQLYEFLQFKWIPTRIVLEYVTGIDVTCNINYNITRFIRAWDCGLVKSELSIVENNKVLKLWPSHSQVSNQVANEFYMLFYLTEGHPNIVIPKMGISCISNHCALKNGLWI